MVNDIIVQNTGGFLPNVEPQSGGENALAVREQSEIQSAIVSAKKFPRDEAACYVKVMKSFQRPSMAESAVYSFPRGKGGARVTGASVDTAREEARCWGNVRYGLRIVDAAGERVHIRGYALDLETNSYCEAEDEFEKKIQRKGSDGITRWVVPDERDLRELISRRGAILVRNCILQILPSDLTEDALLQAKDTNLAVAANKLGTNREDTVRQLAMAFDGIQITPEMLIRKLGHELAVINNEEYSELRAIYKSIRDGQSKREEHFDVAKENAAQADDLTRKIKSAGKPAKESTT